jgi:S-adenosylmethionine synthetase
MCCLEQQSPNIADGVHVNRAEEDVGAGDQVMIYSHFVVSLSFWFCSL